MGNSAFDANAYQGPQGDTGPAGPAGPAGGEALVFDYAGDNFDIPNNSDWADGTPAAIIVDPSNNAIVVAAMDDTDEEGVGGELYVPAGAKSLKFNFVHRVASGQTGGKVIDYQFHFRKIPDNGAIPGAWTTVNLDTMAVPDSNVLFQYELQTRTLTALGLDAGAHYKWELTRYTATAGGDDTVSGDVYLKQLRLEVGVRSIKWYPADTLRSAVNSDWSINANAPVATDSNNAALKVRLHDDTVEEGSGISFVTPVGVTKMKLYVVSRGETAAGGNVEVAMHYRKIADNTAIETWQIEDMASVVVLPANELFQYDSWEMTLADLTTPIVAGTQYQFQITRYATGSGDTYAADWAVLAIGWEFY